MRESIGSELLSELTFPQGERIDEIVEFWQALLRSGDSGSTTWEVLEYFNYRVERCLGKSPLELDLAESLTARAMLHISGKAKL